MLNEVLKSCKKMISADIKTDAKQEVKELVGGHSKNTFVEESRGCHWKANKNEQGEVGGSRNFQNEVL